MVNDQVVNIHLPISKSIANRILLLQAIHGDPLMRVSSDMPDDIIVLHDALQKIREHKKGEPLTLNLKTCGTALRFLQVHLDKCYPGEPIALDGDPRLMERNGKPTSQTTSALILHGVDVPVEPDESPYITMSRKLKKSFSEQRERSYSETVLQRSGLSGEAGLLEADWSASSYWYEYVAIHGGELLLEGLQDDSIQGDRIVAGIYADHFGVQTEFVSKGAVIRSVSPKGGLTVKRSVSETVYQPQAVSIDFSNCPDLYPAVALTCEKLSIELQSSGTERLRYKESDRIEAVQKHEVRNDHRIAMALLAADYLPLPSLPQEREQLQTVIAKSYPQFLSQFESVCSQARKRDEDEPRQSLDHIVPIKGVNDDNLGKKHALSKLIHASMADYVWLHDDDVIWPFVLQRSDLAATRSYSETVLQQRGLIGEADLYILPLRMESQNAEPSLLEKLQIVEYAAIQELTMMTAMNGHAVMCSGANLVVRRKVWLECEPDIHPEIPSGDDMFLLEAAKRRGYTIDVIDTPEYTAIVRPQTSWRAFWRQRMRWAGKAPHYTDRDIILCGFFVVLLNMLQILCPIIFIPKFLIDFSLVSRREPKASFSAALLLEIVYPFYLLVCLIGGLFRRKEW